MEALNLLSQRDVAAGLGGAGRAGPGGCTSTDLEAGIRVPDHGVYPWRLLVLKGSTGPAGARLAERFKVVNPDASDALVTLEAERFLRAPVVVAVVHRPIPSEKIPAWEQQLSAGAVCQNLPCSTPQARRGSG